MSKQYPRYYAVVQEGVSTKITVYNAPQETAVILNHPEAMGLNPVTEFDNSSFVIPDTRAERSQGDAKE